MAVSGGSYASIRTPLKRAAADSRTGISGSASLRWTLVTTSGLKGFNADEPDLSRQEQDQVPSPRRRPSERRRHPEGRRLLEYRIPQDRAVRRGAEGKDR